MNAIDIIEAAESWANDIYGTEDSIERDDYIFNLLQGAKIYAKLLAKEIEEAKKN